MPLTSNANLRSIGIIPGSVGTNSQGVPDIFDPGIVVAGGIAANQIVWAPWYCNYAGILTSFKLRITAFTATKFRVGIYNVGPTSSVIGQAGPGLLLRQTSDVTPVVNDNVTATLSDNLKMQNKWYWLALLADNTITMDFMNHANSKQGLSLMGRDATRVICGSGTTNVSAGWTELPSTAPAISTLTYQNSRLLLRAIYFS